MPRDIQPSVWVSAAAVEAILAAAGRPAPYSPSLIDAIGQWLSDAFERAIYRVRKDALSPADVDKLERAYERFSYIVEALQNRNNPPPMIPKRDCHTEWDVWIAANRAMGFKRGAPEVIEWQLVGELLAFQEIVSRRGAITGHSDGPTIRFLKAAFREAQSHATHDEIKRLKAPTTRAVGYRIGWLRGTYFMNVARDLSLIIERCSK